MAAGPAVAAAAVASVVRYAYVAAIWGYNPGFILGALVLGAALRSSGAKHDLVLLYTDDLPRSSLELLAEVWQLRKVEFVLAHESLFSSLGSRFDGVFTKLHALGLTAYQKVLVLDLDIAVISCPDELFALPAPAAMHRAVRGGRHGTRLEGRHFFARESLDPEAQAYEWGQAGGINAGVMLLAPQRELYERVLKEVRMPVHPEHIPGNGPEQDFLSRIFAPWWTHIGVAYNYQLHRTFHALEGAVHDAPVILGTDNSGWSYDGPERLVLSLEEIKLIHFSGHLKMWDRDFSSSQDDDAFADQLLRDCAGDFCRIWIDKAGRYFEYEERGVILEDEGFVHRDPAVGKAVGPLIDRALEMAIGAARLAVQSWNKALQELPVRWPALPPMPELLERLRRPKSLPGAAFELGTRVEVWTRGNWFRATVRATHDDGTVSVEFEEAGFWGCGARHLRPHRLRPLEGEDTRGST